MATEPVAIKPDPEADSPTAEDELEDAGDVEFYDTSMPGNPNGTMYLARIPAYVWKAWSDLDDDAEIQIGKIRQWSEPDPSGQPKARLQLLLSSELAQHQGIPKEYNLDVTDAHVSNTFIFSEQDLPSFAAKNKEKAAALAQGIPAHLLRQQQQKQSGEEQQSGERGKRARFQNARRAVPKKTKIAGRVKHELACTPVANAETDFILARRAWDAQNPSSKVTIMSRLPANGLMDDKDFEGFIKTAPQISKAKKLENKSARWEQSILIDRLSHCFSQFKFWSMKALRSQINQPEAYIRETLESIAMLHRTGRFANQWALKPDMERMLIIEKKLNVPSSDTSAPAVAADVESDDEEDGDVKMEDVL